MIYPKSLKTIFIILIQGPVAQPGLEHLPSKQGVAGSSPVRAVLGIVNPCHNLNPVLRFKSLQLLLWKLELPRFLGNLEDCQSRFRDCKSLH